MLDCEYSLYDIGIAKFIHKKWTIDDLDAKGDKNVWCRNRDRFVPFFDSTKQCSGTLEKFCQESEKCIRKKKNILKSKGNLKHNCWKKFLLGDQLPTGFPGIYDKYFICQRFAQDDTYIGSTSRKAFYGTVYDTKQRIPLMSFGRLRNLSDTSKPLMKFMIEKGKFIHLDENISIYDYSQIHLQQTFLKISIFLYTVVFVLFNTFFVKAWQISMLMH